MGPWRLGTARLHSTCGTSMMCFDLLIADFNMSQMNGFELTRTIRTTHQTLPSILMSGALDELHAPRSSK